MEQMCSRNIKSAKYRIASETFHEFRRIGTIMHYANIFPQIMWGSLCDPHIFSRKAPICDSILYHSGWSAHTHTHTFMYAVNKMLNVLVYCVTLQFAVEQLVLVPHGSMVELGTHHPVLAESDLSDSSSLSPLPPHSPSHPHHLHDIGTSQHFFDFQQV